ncbi:MAG: D-threonine aldolase [Candidatus Moanabacter tarae]|uniref:D-threonine aldolase n=1 Tax=Candidatus Moanibacter tarae TaxID=2200854 RepID=A0A2Z4AHA4_9BACT|nr:MAG: D-threonine aldolase [Candidatus Moanabacter tarae]|tara:strand:- start:8595 stop:9719 length:1125 start_codon:yes stop_codon:yes gene_type:complete
MFKHAIATVGMSIDEIDTPALLLDLDAFERNLVHLADFGNAHSIQLRPHAKTHKCPEIAGLQIKHGAIGVCCQKVSEAEAMVAGGIKDVLISNEVVGSKKIDRLMNLARESTISVCVDNSENLKAIETAVRQSVVNLSILIEVDVGGNRCGLQPGSAVPKLAQEIVASPFLSFKGLHAYHGGAQHLRNFEERKEAIATATGKVKECVDLLRTEGIECATVTGAGSGTFPFETASGVYNEIQAGSYIFMDADYARNLNQAGENWNDFEHSLFIYSTVMSMKTRRVGIVDAGLKALSVDSGMPIVIDRGEAEYEVAGDEHGKVNLFDSNSTLSLGEKIRLIPGHCDPTINMHDWIIGIRKEKVESIWPITARGPGI